MADNFEKTKMQKIENPVYDWALNEIQKFDWIVDPGTSFLSSAD